MGDREAQLHFNIRDPTSTTEEPTDRYLESVELMKIIQML